MFTIFSTKNKKSKNTLFNAYVAGLKIDRERDAEEMYKQQQDNVDSFDAYKARMADIKSAKKEERAAAHGDREDENARLVMYKNNKKILDIWNGIKEEISARISEGIVEGPPKTIYVEFKTEGHNVTAVVTRNKPIYMANEKEIIYTSDSYTIPGDLDEEIAARALASLCNESLYGQDLVFIV